MDLHLGDASMFEELVSLPVFLTLISFRYVVPLYSCHEETVL